ncbi:MAG TPA: hypothetical protein VF432_10375 [Thermoanaerobaculia bacterium]
MILKGRCRDCDHLFVWDEERYAKQNHVIHCKQCRRLLGGGFKCGNCDTVIRMMNRNEPEKCYACGTAYETPLRESI